MNTATNVYFIRSGDFIKIGYATNVLKRAQSFACANPGGAELLGHIPVDSSLRERQYHDKFETLRERGEWFRADPELLSFIDKNCVRPVKSARRTREPRHCQLNTKVSERARDRVKKMAIAQAACIADIIEDAIDAYWANVQCQS